MLLTIRLRQPRANLLGGQCGAMRQSTQMRLMVRAVSEVGATTRQACMKQDLWVTCLCC
jgi:hypothetical protein